ncbi:DoxX family protein [archaeon]|nr:DoxX family protein [archaeon]
MGLIELSDEWKNHLCVLFRLLIGWMFFEHGSQKLFGWFGGKTVDSLASLMGAAGVIEVVVGLAVVLGLFTRLASLLGAVEMLVAYFMMHFPKGWNPLTNYGEPALLYFAAFLVLYAWGAGKYSLERHLLDEEKF